MVVLRIQHAVPDFDGWLRAFHADPVDRKGAGVHRYSVYRSAADPQFVAIDLEFDTVGEAELLLEKLRRLWTGPGGAVMRMRTAKDMAGPSSGNPAC